MKLYLASQRGLLESVERHIYYDLLKFLDTHTIKNGSFVSIGYFNDHELSYGPGTRKTINAVNDEQLTEFIENSAPSKFIDALQAFQNSPKYQNALAKGKTAPFELDGDVHILKISKIIVNWKDSERFAKFYGDRSDEIAKVRAKHGFGYDEDSYEETDWRRRHGGVGVRPISKAIGRQGAQYDIIHDKGVYNYEGKISLRQVENYKASPKPIWYFIDANRDITEIDNKLMSWLTYAYKGKRVKNEIVEISQEEQEFLDEINSIKNINKKELKLPLDNILYLVGTSITQDGTVEPFIWLNDIKIKELYPYVREDKLNEIIQEYVDISKKDAAYMNRNIVSESRRLNNKNNKNLYNSLMEGISKSIERNLI